MEDIDVPAPPVFNLGALATEAEAELAIKHPKTGDPTSWIWTFYGPAHPVSMSVADKVAREALKKGKEQRQAQINGKKWKEDDQTPDELREQNVDNILARTKSFTPVNLGSGTTDFSVGSARKILLDRRFGWVLNQIVDFLKLEENFIQPSATS